MAESIVEKGVVNKSLDTKPSYSANNPILSLLPKQQLLETLKQINDFLVENHNLKQEEIIHALTSEDQEILIPASIFSTEISPSESLVKYMKENLEKNYHEISLLIKRNEKGLWGSYNRAQKKLPSPFTLKEKDHFIPISIFSDRTLSILESAITYLKDELKMKGSDIASLLNKTPSTIWTAYNRAKVKKNG